MPVPLDEMMRDVSPEERAEIEREAQKLVMMSRTAQAEKSHPSVLARIPRHTVTLAALGAGAASVLVSSAALLPLLVGSLAPTIVGFYFAALYRLARKGIYEADFKDLVVRLDALGQALPYKSETHYIFEQTENPARELFIEAELLHQKLRDVELELENLAKIDLRLNEALPPMALAGKLRQIGVITESEFNLFNAFRFVTQTVLADRNSEPATQSEIARISESGTKLISVWRERARMGSASDRYSRDTG